MIIEYINTHLAQFWVAMGFCLLAIELLTGFASGVFLFTGLGALATGILMTVGIIQPTWLIGLASTGICSGIITALLWQPLRRLQGARAADKDNSSDLVGYQFVLEQTISKGTPGSTHYSGINWKVEIDPASQQSEISSGTRVRVSSVEVGRFLVIVAQQ